MSDDDIRGDILTIVKDYGMHVYFRKNKMEIASPYHVLSSALYREIINRSIRILGKIKKYK